MKTILCYGDSNVRGVTPEPIDKRTGLTKRYLKNKRWTSVLQNMLGDNYDIIVEGMGGRTTIFDELIPGRPYRNGVSLLPVCLESHYPIDLVIFLLGTNDTKIQFHASINQISEGMRQLINIVKGCNKGPLQNSPKILIIAPPPIIKVPNLFPQFDDTSIEKSRALPALYQQLADDESCACLDASLIITASKVDGIHFDEDQCVLLANAVAKKIIEIFKEFK